MLLWIQFLSFSAIILFAGTQLSRYGDILAEKTSLGRTWIGVILLAMVTSLPELITGMSSVVVFDVPNIAVGNVLGACGEVLARILRPTRSILSRLWPIGVSPFSPLY